MVWIKVQIDFCVSVCVPAAGSWEHQRALMLFFNLICVCFFMFAVCDGSDQS